jgi:hypothetical protein
MLKKSKAIRQQEATRSYATSGASPAKAKESADGGFTLDVASGCRCFSEDFCSAIRFWLIQYCHVQKKTDIDTN